MAKKKTYPQNNDKMSVDLEFLTHKYSDFYKDKNSDELIQEIGQEQESFYWYDTKEVFYPMYKSKICYTFAKEMPIHPIILNILELIKEIQKLKNIDSKQMLQDITQLDTEILSSILAGLQIKGYIKDNINFLDLSEKGKEILKEKNEQKIEQSFAYVISDGIFGEIKEPNKETQSLFLETGKNINEQSIELKPQGDKRLRTQSLSSYFNEEQTLTLRQLLREKLQGLDEGYEVKDIEEVQDCKKYFQKFICLFFINKEKSEKILALNERLEIDEEATRLFDRLIDTSKFEARQNEALKENKQEFENATPEHISQQKEIDLEAGKTIQTKEHKKYFLYILGSAKKAVYIQSPWVRYEILEVYKNDLESALKRGVKIYIKYGIKPRNKFDKAGIDEKSKELFKQYKQTYPQYFFVKNDNSHEKILICDEDFMLIGSFNWLSFLGKSIRNEELRKETSSINKNEKEINKHIQEFLKN